jgi:signal transduction histidine kinase
MVDLKDVVDESVDLLLGNARQKGITMHVNVGKNFTAYVDVNQITTVVRNLVSNAIKFTPKDGTITCSVEDNGLYWKVSIKDTGVGIAEKDKEKLFKIDTNITTMGTSQETGTGLGLILCKEFVERNGGTVWVESKEGEGSTFSFTVPKTDLSNS